jgi:KaiC/GvpD/RAD55 family RecA-like ATPase
MDLSKELIENKTVLAIVPSEKYSATITSLTKTLSKKKVCYVTLNKTFESLKEEFKKKNVKIDNLVFIDAISKTIKDVPDQTTGCYFASSPGDLTGISLLITKFLNHEFDYIIFDSLTNLIVYQQKAPVARFVQVLTNKIRESKTRAVFFAVSVKEQQNLLEETGMFVDKVIKL